MNKETGGPAFPCKQKALLINSEHQYLASEYEIECNGMTLRDYFAAKAMQALLIATKTADGNMIIKDAYNIADAMLKARNQ